MKGNILLNLCMCLFLGEALINECYKVFWLSTSMVKIDFIVF